MERGESWMKVKQKCSPGSWRCRFLTDCSERSRFLTLHHNWICKDWLRRQLKWGLVSIFGLSLWVTVIGTISKIDTIGVISTIGQVHGLGRTTSLQAHCVDSCQSLWFAPTASTDNEFYANYAATIKPSALTRGATAASRAEWPRNSDLAEMEKLLKDWVDDLSHKLRFDGLCMTTAKAKSCHISLIWDQWWVQGQQWVFHGIPSSIASRQLVSR